MDQESTLEGNKNKQLTANEYAAKVREWTMQYNLWHQSTLFSLTFPYYMMGCMSSQALPSQITRPLQQTNVTFSQPQTRPRESRTIQVNVVQREYTIAPIWKRFMAELLDFFMLFLLKLGVTIVAVENLGLIDLDQYELDLEKLFSQDLEFNYTLAFNMTSELVALEVLNRVFITLFEAMCLRRGVAGFIGGATPGKRLMGICVVSSEELVIELGNGRVQVTPAGNIGFWNALVRSVIKNFSLAFFFPVCFTALFFQHHRAAYDVIANCIVVEPVRPQRIQIARN